MKYNKFKIFNNNQGFYVLNSTSAVQIIFIFYAFPAI